MIPGGALLRLEACVNLGNYESLRVSVEAQCRSMEETDELHAFLDAELGKFGRTDLEIGARVDAWRSRVLGTGPIGSAPVEAAGTPAASTIAEKKVEPKKVPVTIPEGDTITIEGKTYQRKKAPAAAPPKAEATPKTEPKPAPKAKAPAASFVCDTCGGPVTASEEKTSRLFLSKTLCKGCVDQINHKEE